MMKKYVIERDIPGVGELTAVELQHVAQNSNEIIDDLKNRLQWIESYITGEKIYDVYLAPSEELIRQHAQRAGLPVDSVSEVVTIIDPTTASE